MASEDMEITTDFGHQGSYENTEVDLDLTAELPDQDLDLGDADADDLQHFNSDTRDELMAEGDDTLCGMVDADDVIYNETAAAANDYDIDIGGVEDGTWQNKSMADEITYDDRELPADTDIEITQVEEMTSHDATGQDDLGDASASREVVDAIEENMVEELSTIAEADVSEQNLHTYQDEQDGQSKGSPEYEQGTEAMISSEGRTNALVADAGELDVEPVASEDQHAESESLEASNTENKEVESTGLEAAASEDQQAEAAGLENQQTDVDPNLYADDIAHNFDDYGVVNPDKLGEQANVDFNDHGEGIEPSCDQYGDQQAVAQDENEQLAPGDEGSDEWAEDGGLAANNEQPADDSYGTTDGHFEDGVDIAQEARLTEYGSSVNSEDVHDAEQIYEIASLYEMYIVYGDRDYKLFAKFEGDDPYEYFLSSVKSLHIPLHAFLARIRAVIDDEISPLDEIVIFVDGLGLEFGETMTKSGFLEEFTFGDIVSLYDKFVTNTGGGDHPALWLYLMVRPNCRQRFAALLDQARAGRTLADIAVYRQTSVSPGRIDSSPGAFEDNDFYDEDETSCEEDDEEVAAYEGRQAANSVETTSRNSEVDGFEESEERAIANYAETDNRNGDGEVDGSEVEPDALTPGNNNGAKTDERTSKTPTHEPMGEKLAGDGNFAPSISPNSSASDSYAKPCKFSSECRCDDCYLTGWNLELEVSSDPNNSDQIELGRDNTTAPETNGCTPHHSSATVTLNGDDKDEIDFSDEDDVDVSGGLSQTAAQDQPVAPTHLDVPVEDEITWESDNEEVQPERPTSASKESLQVSATPGKRLRSESDAVKGECGQNGT